jgi:hypothetical protein
MNQDRTFVRMDAIIALEDQLKRYRGDYTPNGQLISQETLESLKRDLETAINDGEGDWFTERYRQHFGEHR